MSGVPAFQASAFEQDAFQSGQQVVAGDYSLGSPSFAAPALKVNYQFAVSPYSLGSPQFAKPPIASALITISVNAYSLGPLAFSAANIRATQRFNAPSYSLGALGFGSPVVLQTQRLFTNAMALDALDFGSAAVHVNRLIIADSYSLGALEFLPVGPTIHINTICLVNPYSLGSPSFGYPRLQWEVVDLGLPDTELSQIIEAGDMLETLLNLLMRSLPSSVSPQTNQARRFIDILRSNSEEAIRGTTLGTQLADIYRALEIAEASYIGIENARLFLMAQVASRSYYTQIVFRNALLMNLALESSIITKMTFKTREEAHNAILHARDMFEQAQAIGIDEVDVHVYQSVTALGGALINYLSTEALELPRFVEFESAMPMPSLYLAQRIYQDASRSDELELENGVINPAFVPRRIRVLSNIVPRELNRG